MDALASEKYSFILYGGAMGGGKTFFGLSALLIMCQIFPGSRWCVIRENMEKIRTTTIPSFRKLKASGKLRESPYEYTHPNGSVILFKGENYAQDKELDWLKGLEVNGFLFEEINECQEPTLDLAFSRAGRWECEPRPAPIILATCNPTKNWVKAKVFDRWENGLLPIEAQNKLIGVLPKTWLYIPSKVTDNPHLTQAYLDNLQNMTKLKYEIMVNGNWNLQMKSGGEFYKCFEIEDHIAPVIYDSSLPLHISWDDNVNPYLPCGIFQIVKRDNIRKAIMIDEIAGVTPRNTITEVCKEVHRRYPAHASGMFIYGDSTANKEDTKQEKGHNFFRLILDALIKYKPTKRVVTNPSVVMRGNWINTVLEKKLGGIEVVIGDNCKHTINDFVNLKEDADGTKLKEVETDPKTKVRSQKYGHFTDLFDYFMVSAFAGDYAKYQAGNVTHKRAMGRGADSANSY